MSACAHVLMSGLAVLRFMKVVESNTDLYLIAIDWSWGDFHFVIFFSATT